MEQLVSRPDAQTADANRSKSVLGYGAAKPRRHGAASREQGGDRLTVEARERMAESRERRGVKPLDVVDGDADRTVAGEQSQRPEERGGDRALVGLRLRLPEQQRGLERAALDRRQLGQDIGGVVAEEIGQPRERELPSRPPTAETT